MAKPLDESTRAAILKDAAAGMNTNQIAEKHQVGWITAKNVISGNGHKPAGGGKRVAKAKHTAAGSNVHFAVKLSAEGLDAVWNALPAEKKAELLGNL